MAKKTKAELQDTVIYLERELEETKKRLQFYEQHFKSCRTASPISPPPDHHHNETSVRRTLEEPPAEGRGSTNTAASTQHTALVSHEDVPVKRALINTEAYSNPSTLKDHEASNPNTTSDTSGGQVPGTQKRKQWENDAFTLAAKFKKPRREQRYLEPLSSHDAIITSIVHGTSCDIQALSMNPSMDPIAAVKRYASIARDSRVRAELASCISSFQDLIFHSMCIVLEYCGYPVEDIDMAMRIRSSASGPKNLKRLRSGAGWANEVISKSTEGEWTGIGDCIAELYFHYDIKMSVYGILADSRARSIPFFVQCLSEVQFEIMPLPWCIPAFVRIVLPAPEITLEDICVALMYKATTAQRVKNIVSEYEDGINRVLRLHLQRQAYTLSGLSQREGLLESPMMDSPPGPSKNSPPTRDGQETSAEQANTPTLPVTASSSGNGSADMFDPSTFELSSFATPEFELSVFASPSDFELSLVAQQLIHSTPAESSTSHSNNE
ncbi:hypothetical protein F5Y09DRAFT_320558 [Xylaria sp. FL1042]|nr:hypothetical protein F5Y09DRAFT_320558 [Xylaria sp. FL1042]